MTGRADGYTLDEIVSRLGGRLTGEGCTRVVRVATLEHAGPGEIAFLANPRYRRQLASSRAAAVVLSTDHATGCPLPCIVSDNPYAYYARVAQLLNPPPQTPAGIHPAAVSESQLDPSVSVAAGAIIGKDVSVGEHCVIGPACILGDGVRLGAHSRLYGNVTVYAGCAIGRRVIIHAGAVIGADGFGMAPDAGRWVKIPQVGRAVLGDDVEVGANTTIDRGALGDTVVEEGVKIDNQVQVAHNCRIGAHTVIAGCTGIAGSAVIGRHCVIGGGVGIVGHITIADGVTVTGTTFVTKSITEPGVYSSGMPMMPHADWLRNAVRLRRLGERPARGGRNPGEDDGTA